MSANQEHSAVTVSSVVSTRRSPIPNYTPEQKVAAFDTLWENCGLGKGLLKDYVTRDITRPCCPLNESVMLRVPRYEFTIIAEGEMFNFYDVLHYLATHE